MKRTIITVITLIACVALRTAVWPQNTEVEDLPAEMVKADATGEIEPRSDEKPHILLLSADMLLLPKLGLSQKANHRNRR